ncbi:MAG: type II toxin-antitoxin system RelE/ParE family toxin [Hyphomonadaceae bacterium]|nr:type II toxin-antitoxin system RelE/ParE family toxin [Hyphomonadaceae bacterium]
MTLDVMYHDAVHSDVPITSFADDSTARLFAGDRVRGVANELAQRARRRLQQLDAALSLNDLAAPGADLKKLKGVTPETWQIRVNDQFRVRFQIVRLTPLEVAEVWFGDPH